MPPGSINKEMNIIEDGRELIYKDGSVKMSMNSSVTHHVLHAIDDEAKLRASSLKTAYTVKSQDPREGMRVKSLQLLCFKIANHKKKILSMLDKYHHIYKETEDNPKNGMVHFH